MDSYITYHALKLSLRIFFIILGIPRILGFILYVVCIRRKNLWQYRNLWKIINLISGMIMSVLNVIVVCPLKSIVNKTILVDLLFIIIKKIGQLLCDELQQTSPKDEGFSPFKTREGISICFESWKGIKSISRWWRGSIDQLVEREIYQPIYSKPKNWLFNGSPRGARASAATFSLVETAKANNLDPHDYI